MTDVCGFNGSNVSHIRRKLIVIRCRSIQCMGKNSASLKVIRAMHVIDTIDNWNLKARILQVVFLQVFVKLIPRLRRNGYSIQKGADMIFSQNVAKFAGVDFNFDAQISTSSPVRVCYDGGIVDLRHLTDLFFQGHFGDQIVYFLFNALIVCPFSFS